MRYLKSILRGRISNNTTPFIIAEMACAHNGNVEEAKAIIDAASVAKADAIQLQFFVADETVTPNHEAYSVIKSIEFDTKIWSELVAYSKEKELLVFACTYDVPSVQLAVETNCDGIKLNSSDLSNPDVLKAVAASKIPFTLGTGASSLQEIESGLSFLQANGAEEVVLMHGVQNFPTAIENLNINRLEWLKTNFPDIPVGYADHTEGDHPMARYIDLMAVSKGVAVIEKHITLDRSKKGIDYQAALEPAEYTVFVETIRKGFQALGSTEEKPFTESDLRYRKFQKKSIVANANLRSGDIITRDKITYLRNKEPGLLPTETDVLLGKKIVRDINRFENILTSDIA